MPHYFFQKPKIQIFVINFTLYCNNIHYLKVQILPFRQASWRGVLNANGGLTSAPFFISSSTQGTLPTAQASHKGVPPSKLVAFTLTKN